LLGAEGDAGLPALGRIPEAAHRHAEQDRQHQRLHIGVREQAPFRRFEGRRDAGDDGAKENAGNERCKTADAAGRPISWGGKFLVLRHQFLLWGERFMRLIAIVR
jgi:hypothetical protein